MGALPPGISQCLNHLRDFFFNSFTSNCWVVPIFRHIDPQQCSLQKFSVDLYLYPISCLAKIIEIYRLSTDSFGAVLIMMHNESSWFHVGHKPSTDLLRYDKGYIN
jgi:hypothetical protein